MNVTIDCLELKRMYRHNSFRIFIVMHDFMTERQNVNSN